MIPWLIVLLLGKRVEGFRVGSMTVKPVSQKSN
jgi:hypothetical protein